MFFEWLDTRLTVHPGDGIGNDAEGGIPNRQLMIDNGVSTFFHGHDHRYVYRLRDGNYYQFPPMPCPGLDFDHHSEGD